MNVLMMVSWFGEFAGAEQGGGFHYEQAVDLNRLCNCAIYYPYDRNINERFVKRKESGIVVYRSKYCLQKKLRNRLFMYQAMKKIVEDFHPDIIHGNVATESGRFAVVLGKLFHIPVMITEHSAIEASGVSSFPHYYYAKFTYAHSRYNACVSDNLMHGLQEIFPKYSFHTIYNGIQKHEIAISPVRYRKSECVNIGMVAGFYSREIKGVQFVLPAIRKMLDQGYRVTLHIMGGGDFLQEYIDMALNLKINENCIFYGTCKKDKLFAIEAEMDFVVSASIFESFGCAVAEAAMLGKPIVASKSGGVESIVNAENGILVEKGSVDAIYEGLAEMYHKYNNYDTEQISKYAQEHFSINAISDKYMKVYKKILETGE